MDRGRAPNGTTPYNYENLGKYITLSGQHHIWILKFNYDRFVWQRDLKSV